LFRVPKLHLSPLEEKISLIFTLPQRQMKEMTPSIRTQVLFSKPELKVCEVFHRSNIQVES
jgi:hypothetical protein